MLSGVSVFQNSVHMHTILCIFFRMIHESVLYHDFELIYALVYRIFIGVDSYLTLSDCFKRLIRIVS